MNTKKAGVTQTPQSGRVCLRFLRPVRCLTCPLTCLPLTESLGFVELPCYGVAFINAVNERHFWSHDRVTDSVTEPIRLYACYQSLLLYYLWWYPFKEMGGGKGSRTPSVLWVVARDCCVPSIELWKGGGQAPNKS